MAPRMQLDGTVASDQPSGLQITKHQPLESSSNHRKCDKNPNDIKTPPPSLSPGSFRIVWRNLSYTVRENGLNPANVLAYFKTQATRMMMFGLDEPTESVKRPDKTPADWWAAVKTINQRRTVFANVSGHLESGKITALMGPSGAGKTSLLNAITAHRRDLTGHIQVIGARPTRASLKIAFIPQKDDLIETLTVRENLMFASQIKNSALAAFDHGANVAKVVKMLNLGDCLDSLAGQISGGEYKRASIGQEFLSRPDLLVLDEPTSGLDSLSCKRLILSLKALLEVDPTTIGADARPLAILLTIHQPSVDIFHMFDRVYFMSRQGSIIYDGEPGLALDTIEKVSAIADRPQICSPSSYLMEIASGEFGEKPLELLGQHQRECFAREMGLNEGKPSEAVKFYRDPKMFQEHHEHRGQFLTHLNLLTRRALISTWRQPLVRYTSLFFYMSLPIVMYTVYPREASQIDLCPVVVRDIDILTLISEQPSRYLFELMGNFRKTVDNVSMLYLTMVSIITCTIAISAMMFPMSVHTTLKEYRNGWYSLTSYSLARTLSNLPFETIMPMVSMSVTYNVLGQARSYMEWRMVTMVATVVLVNMISSAHGLINGALFIDSVEGAVFASISSTFSLSLLSGFMARFAGMPKWLQTVASTNYYRQAFLALTSIRFGHNKCPCDERLEKFLAETRPRLLVPDQIRSLVDYAMKNATLDSAHLVEEPNNNNSNDNLLDRLTSQVAHFFSLGGPVTSCSGARSNYLQGVGTQGDELASALTQLVATLILFHLALIILTRIVIKRRM